MWGPSRHVGILTAANWVSFNFNVCLLLLLRLLFNTHSQIFSFLSQQKWPQRGTGMDRAFAFQAAAEEATRQMLPIHNTRRSVVAKFLQWPGNHQNHSRENMYTICWHKFSYFPYLEAPDEKSEIFKSIISRSPWWKIRKSSQKKVSLISLDSAFPYCGLGISICAYVDRPHDSTAEK